MAKKKEVLIIFKTHLDIGYTDYAGNIVSRYLEEYIPNAIQVGYELKDTDTPFKWTVGSWLVRLALKTDTTGTVAQAIRDGILCWHALPFATYTESMNAKLFEFGLNISGELDRKFNKKTIGAKMSDVPGHTISMVPLMRKHGIRFLHLGINVASPLPDVPPIFKWRFQDDEITVMYQSGHGEVFELADCIIYFAHTSDNVGPQTAQQIIDIYASVKEAYPDCTVRAGTIDDIAEQIAKLEDLPVIDREIGDTWIHGIGSDPQKLSRYRKLLRQINQMDALPPDLAESLLCIPEHTWGMDSKRFFPYDQPYSHTEMRQKLPLWYADEALFRFVIVPD